MKKTINIFVAGAKDLEVERLAIKSLESDINKEYKEKGNAIEIDIRTFENVEGDKQENYDFFIQNESDIVIVILKNEIHKYTERELEIAANAYKEKKIPEIIVFLNKDKKETSEIKKIEELLEKHLGDGHFYVEYANTKELQREAKKRIENFARPFIQTNNIIRRWLMILLAACALFFAGLYIWKFVYNSTSPNLLFVGGGSAINYIKENKDIDICNYPHSIYASMPSSIAQSMLGEEFNRSKSNYNFVTVCLSAEKAKISQLLKHCNKEEFIKAYNIVECYLGEDTMAIFVQNSFYKDHPNKIMDNQNTITPKQLYDLLKESPSNINFYCTNPQSGTRNYYNMHLLKEHNDTTIKDMSSINSKIEVFNERDGENLTIENSSYIIMGSNCYYPKSLNESTSEDKRFKKLMFVDNNNPNKIITKGVYLYFIAKRIENDKIIIPNIIYNLLQEIDITNKIINNNTLLRRKKMMNAAGDALQQLNKREDYIKE